MDWIYLAQFKDKWVAVVNTAMKCLVASQEVLRSVGLDKYGKDFLQRKI
jgi:glutathione peroxidase-family protein